MTSNSPEAGNTRRVWMWARLVALVALLPATWLLARSPHLPKVTLCMFQRVTGKPCPGCGMTRSLLALSQGDFAESFRMHPVGFALAAVLLATIVGTAVGLARGTDPPRRFLERHGPRFVGWLVVVLVAQWVLRAWIVPAWAPEPVELQAVEEAAADAPPVAAPRDPPPRAPPRPAHDAPTTQPPPAAAPRGLDDVVATLEGRVVDAETGKPVAGAALQWGYVDPTKDELLKNLWGETTADGSLKFVYPRNGYWAPERPDDVAELWVSAKGYAIAKIRAPLSPIEVRLAPAPERAPGTVRVRALRGDRVPWTGLVRVEAQDAFGDAETLCGIADADGRFTLIAVPARLTRFRVDDRSPWTAVVVAPDGWTDVDLRGPAAGPFAELTIDAVVAKRDAAAAEMESAKTKNDAAGAAAAEATWKAAWDEISHRRPAQRTLVFESLPADAAPLVEVRVETHGPPIIWRLTSSDRRVTLCTQRDGPHWWRVTVTRADGSSEARGVVILGARDGKIEAATGPADAVKRAFPLTKDDALVVDWEQLVPDRK